MSDVIGQLLRDNNMPDTPTARAIYRKMLEEDDDTQVYQKPWVGLTDDEYRQILKQHDGAGLIVFYNLIHDALRSKNT